MKKIFLLLMFGILFINGSNVASAITTNQIFFDGLEIDNFESIWTNDAANKFSRSTGTVYEGTYAILADGGTANALLTLTTGLNLTNQTTCNLTSVMRIHPQMGGNEYLCMDYSIDGGTTWNMDTGSDGGIGGLCQDGNVDTEDAWRNVSYSFSASGIESFKVRFRLNSNRNVEDGYIDNINLTCESNDAPTISNITASHSIIKGGNLLTIYANTTSHSVNDTEADTLYLYCDTTDTPTAVNSDCTGGTLSDSTYPYALTCTFATPQTDESNIQYCRVYDGNSYSFVVNLTYITDSTPPITSIISVAGDTSPSYFDSVNDGRTNIIISGEEGMSCRWSSSDIVYSSMTNDCVIEGTQANCSVNDVGSQGFITRYVSCQDSLGNEQNTTQNLDVQFYLDYTAPTTSDNGVATLQATPYVVTITELDNVDSDPTTYYCTSSIEGCNPTTLIDDGGTITYTTSNRGVNYLRYYSIDEAGNSQTVVNKTININRLPILTSATDDAVIIRGGVTVNVSTVSSDSDTGQEIILYVCSTPSATSSGCSGTQYCTATEIANLSCTFSSEIDSGVYNWYAYIYDDLDEPSINNPLSGSYTTDSSEPTITLVSPLNNTEITQGSVTFTIVVNEALTNAWYSLDNGVSNVTMTNTSLYAYTHSNTSITDGIYNMTFWANDSYGNVGSLSGNYFIINTAVADTTPPTITIRSPVNNSYYTGGSVLLNITTDEILSWAGYSNNSNTISSLGNVSTTNWNATTTLAEGQHNITFYANDTNNNQANSSIIIYVDLTNPSVDAFSCTDANDSVDVICSANLSDAIGLSYAIIGYNATGSWQNSSQISLSGNSSSLSYIIAAGNTTPPGFTAAIYLYDLSGRSNLTSSVYVNVYDNTPPEIYNITYYPNTTEGLDPDVRIDINATIVEDYNISSVVLMYKNSSASDWNSLTMTNNSALVVGSSSNIIYNASFIPQTETYYFKINATDAAGNQNISSEYVLIVANDTSQNITTTIPLISSFTYLQRADNNSLGSLVMNNTGDGGIDFNITLSSSSNDIQNRLSVNYTGNQSYDYLSIGAYEAVDVIIDVNTTGLTSGLYDYNITIVSQAGTTTYSNYLNIQTSVGAYLSVSITTYSSSVTTSQTGVSYIATVTNLGTQESTGTILNWTLPGIFSLVSGSLSRNLGTIAIGSSGTNSITVDVGSSTSDITYHINATASSTNANSSSDYKSIVVSNPITITNIVTIPGTSGGGGGSGGAGTQQVIYSKIIEVVRGEKDSFEIEIENKNSNATLKDLAIDITGFLAQYIEITPKKLSSIGPKDKGIFVVTLKAPAYKESYEEHLLKAVITGFLDSGTSKQSYTETQNIKLIIQEISREESDFSLIEAEEAIQEMKEAEFNTGEVSKLLEQAKNKLSENRNKEAFDLSQKIIDIKNKASNTNNLIRRVAEALQNPKKSYLLVGNVVKDFNGNDKTIPLKNIITGRTIFGSESTRELLQLAIAAFERGDYNTAEERAKSAQSNLILERRGNLGIFFYLYWHFVLIGLILFITFGIFSYKAYQKSSITRKIQDIDKEEDNIRNLILSCQRNYFSGKISVSEYHRIMSQHQNKLARIKQERLNLRNKRIKMLKPQQILQDLGIERLQVENEIKKLQAQFYRDRKISESEYKTEFKILNERLAEIEGEKITLEMLKQKKIEFIPVKEGKFVLEKGIIKSEKKVKEQGRFRIFFLKLLRFIKFPFIHITKIRENKRLKEETKIKEKIRGMKIV